MARGITVRIQRDGGLQTEFSGFAGQDCIAEAEKLQRALASLGVRVKLADAVMKTPEALAAETTIEQEQRPGQLAGQERRGRP